MDVREQRRQERADARAGRRPDADGPVDRLERALTDNVGGVDLKRALTTAVAAAVVGGLAGAAKAFADRNGRAGDGEEHAPQPRSEAEEPRDDEEQRAPDDLEQQAPDDEEQHASGDEEQHAPDDEEQHAPDDEAAPGDDAEQDEDEEEKQRPAPVGAASADVEKVIARAKQHVEQVLEAEPEGISGVERTQGNWCVNVEVVKLRRIPDSTDVLASYAVFVDGDGDLVSLHEARRYRRSQSEEDR